MRSKKRKKQGYNDGEKLAPWRESLHGIIFGSETRIGKFFDIVLIISIIFSVIAVMLGSVVQIQLKFGEI